MPDKLPLLPYIKVAAEAPALPVRQPFDKTGFAYIAKASLLARHSQGISLLATTTEGEKAQISLTLVAPGIVRVLLETATSQLAATYPKTKFAKNLNWPTDSTCRLEEAENLLTLSSELVRVQITLEPFQITYFCAATGRKLLEQNNSDRDATTMLATLPFGFSQLDGQAPIFHDSFNCEPDEHFYGFGEKFTNFDKRGQQLVMWNYDSLGEHNERAYKNVPFFVSTHGYGIFVDSAAPVHFDIAAANHSIFSFVVPDSNLDYYVLVGPELKTVVTSYSQLVGFPELPPKWAFGLWMSSGFQADSAEMVLSRARQLREKNIPCDVLHLDCYWQRFGYWSDLVWNAELFPNPAKLLADIKALGFKICLWINPYFSVESERFSEAATKGYLLKNVDGQPYRADMWNGYQPLNGILDVTNPAAVSWFKNLLHGLLQIGVDVFKTDFGEAIPVGTLAYNGMSGKELHNIYPLLYNDLVAEVTAEVSGQSGIVWARSSFAGGQRHAAQWSGDTSATYQGLASTLRGGLSIGMCGHAFWSHDIGGFSGAPTTELYLRWAQFGLLSPLSRAHGTGTRLPWDFGVEAENIFRSYAELRYRLLPYIYTYAKRAAETGLPMLRPMALEFPHDPATYTLDLQYMLGEELLVAPHYNSEGRRPVYFPVGYWLDYWTNQLIEGPGYRTIETNLATLPLYVRVNSLLPLAPLVEYLPQTDAPFDEVSFIAYLLENEQASFKLADVDGITELTARRQGSQLVIQKTGPMQSMSLQLVSLPGNSVIETVTVNGEFLPRSTSSANFGWRSDEHGVVVAYIR